MNSPTSWRIDVWADWPTLAFLCEQAEKVYVVDYGGAVGRRYRRQDEAGTPFCFTIDGQTLQDQTVTIRERDSLRQYRVGLDGAAAELRRLLRGE